jgi:hypothetical protein
VITVTYILVSLVLNTVSGEPISQPKFVSGPYTDVIGCNSAQLKTGIQKPRDGRITVYACQRIESSKTDQQT